jgi:integrase
VFPTLPIHRTESGGISFNGTTILRKLIARGAPADFSFHAARHTLATWLENKDHSEWERAVVLNHSGSGSVTANYSHGAPVNLKLDLLTKWSDQVEKLVTAEGVALLR